MLKRWNRAASALVALGTLAPFSWSPADAAAADLAKFPGVVVDDSQAELTGEWKTSTSVHGFTGEGYRVASGPALHSATFKLTVPAEGEYHLLVGYTIGGNRSTNAALAFAPTTGEQTLALNQQAVPQGPRGLHTIGKFRFAAGETKVVISTKDAKGVVIADAVALLTPEQFATAAKQTTPANKLATVTKPAKPKVEAPPAAPVEPTPEFVRTPPKQRRELTPGQLDGLLQVALPELKQAEAVSDEQFLRRVSLDLIGRNPTREELVAFVADVATNKRAQLVERQLASPEFGENWANYWSDVISYRVPDPELTFLNYKPFKAWLADSINQGRGWDEMTFRILAAQGKVSEHPEATFVGFHQADKSRLASETTRVFLGTQIQCAECHDHKFIDMPQETFHHFAAFFARSQAKISQNDSGGIVVGGKASGEHTLPGKKDQMTAEAFDMAKVELGASDMQRRGELAKWTVSPENPFFAKAFVNRVWARMMGRGFCE
ncbi:MAG TPA: DUF1549 domain-containing protein, partial [Pirellulaceae bacterium]|nr:DUF1549 domain-containing protein [Pirellulaceae bacterium]